MNWNKPSLWRLCGFVCLFAFPSIKYKLLHIRKIIQWYCNLCEKTSSTSIYQWLSKFFLITYSPFYFFVGTSNVPHFPLVPINPFINYLLKMHVFEFSYLTAKDRSFPSNVPSVCGYIYLDPNCTLCHPRSISKCPSFT